MSYTDALLSADFKTTPWRHQIREFEAGVEEPARALLWQMRTGKSKMMVDTASHLYRRGLIDCVLVLAPNGVHENWILREVPTHLWDGIPWRGHAWDSEVHGRTRANMTKAQAAAMKEWWQGLKADFASPDLLWLAFNNESVTRKDVRNLIARARDKRKCLVIWDEASDYRTPGSKRTLMMKALGKRVPFRRILDGTLSTNSALHVFAPYELLGEGTLGFTRYGDFEEHFAHYDMVKAKGGRRFPKFSHYKNLDDLKARMAPVTTVVLRSDCEDLPDLIKREVVLPMTEEQLKALHEITNRIKVELAGKPVSIREQAARLLKLQQVSSGFLIDEFKEVHKIPGRNPRLEALLNEVRRTPGKVIIWCCFHEEMDQVAAALGQSVNGRVLEYHGRVSTADKAKARVDFQEADDVKALVAHPRSAGRGLELSAADKIIWYSHTFDAIIREQANERATKMAGANVELVDFVVEPGPDRYILDTLANKVNVADDVAGRGLQDVLKLIANQEADA